jgi:L,D-transpeptidase YcbB
MKTRMNYLLLFLINSAVCFSQNSKTPLVAAGTLLLQEPLLQPELVAQFYGLRAGKLFWYDTVNNGKQRQELLKKNIDSCIYLGLIPEKYHAAKIGGLLLAAAADADSAYTAAADRLFTDAAIAFSKDLYEGKNIPSLVSYDEISKKYTIEKDSRLLSGLAAVKTPADLTVFFASLEPAAEEYHVIKKELRIQLYNRAAAMAKQLSMRLNIYRWVSSFKFINYIVVNIPSATLTYYTADTVGLRMKVVVGKPSTKTPRFAAYCNQLILYPYWNVPSSIALYELLPKVKKNPAVLNTMNMQVVDGAGNIIPALKINWHQYHSGYFPYRFRQSTGCDNSLGILKFNITAPYSVYLHDTNNKTAFLSGARFYSHGCIRLQKPIELGNLLLQQKLDTAFLQSCYKAQQPVTVALVQPVPVFVIYSTAEPDVINRIKYYKDVYGLLK